MKSNRQKTLQNIYRILYKEFGPQCWWPAQTRFEVMVGAILTQNTNWGNVERAILNLKRKKVLSLSGIRKIPRFRLAVLLKPSGYFNIKAKRLKNFVDFVFKEYQGNLSKMVRQPLAKIRAQLLEVNGIGPETADSILLYALDKPVFVVDAYTKRVFSRHGLTAKDANYEDIQRIFMTELKQNIKMFNEYHALIVRLAKEFCRTKPLCDECPLNILSTPFLNKQ